MGSDALINILIWTIFQETTHANAHVTYKVHDVNVTYDEAWHLCLKDGDRLAEFRGEDDSNLNSLITTVDLPSYCQFWVNDTEAFMVKQTCTYLSTERNSSRCDFTAANCSIKLGYICQTRPNKTGMVDYTDGPSTTLQSSGDTEMYSQSPDSKALYSSTEVLPSETTIPNKKATSKFSSSSDSAVLYNSSEANTRGTTESDTTTLRNSTDSNTITTRKVSSNSVSTASCNSSETVLSQTTESYNHRPRNITSPNPNSTSKFSSSSDSTALYNSSGAPSSETTKSDTTILRNTTDLNAKTTASSDFITSYTSTEVPPSETTEPYTITARNITNTKTETTSMFSSSLDSSSLYNSSEMLLSETTESYSTVAIATTTDPKAKTTAFLSSSSALYNSSEALPGEMKEPYTTTHRNITSSNVKTTLNFPLTSVSKAILYKNYSEMLTYQASETIETFTTTPSNSTSPKANTDTEASHVFAETSTQKDIVTRPENSNLDNTYISASNCTQLCCTNYHFFCHKDKMVHKQNTTKIFHDMNIDKTTIGRHTRRLSSATDHRTSSKVMGIGAMLIIGSIVAFVVAMDVPIVVNYIRGVHHLNYPDSV